MMIGARLKMLREEHGLTQEGLGTILGVSKTAVSGYETDRNSPNDDIKVHIAEYFDISLDYLLGAIDEPAPLNRKDTVNLPAGFNNEDIASVRKYVGYIKANKN